MTTDQKIDLFFKNPAEQPDGSIQGVLYLLRREVQDCFIGKVVPEDQVIAESQKDRHRLFATVMVIMAGIDLLAKFYAGSDENGGVEFGSEPSRESSSSRAFLRRSCSRRCCPRGAGIRCSIRSRSRTSGSG